MKKTFFTGLSSLLLPLGLYGVPTQAAVGYQRSYLSAGMSATSTHGSIDVLTHARELITREAVTSDELNIVSAVPVNELVVIDAAVPDKHVLYRGIKPGVDVVELNAGTAGLAQLTKLLAQYKNLAALHIVSHAEEGVLLLGNSRIDADLLKQEVELFSALNGSMNDGADLLFYGCNLAKGSSGAELLDVIQANTQLNLAASDDLTGDSKQDGDWDLEILRGQIETDLVFSHKALMEFPFVLAPTTFRSSEMTYEYGAVSLTKVADDRIIFSGPDGYITNFPDAGPDGAMTASYRDGNGYLSYIGARLQVAANPANTSTFELHELKLCVDSGAPGTPSVDLIITGYNSSNDSVVSANVNVTTARCFDGDMNASQPLDLTASFGSNYDLRRFVISYQAPAPNDRYFAFRSVTLDDIKGLNAEPTATNLTQTVSYTEDPGGSVVLNDIVVTDDDVGDPITATLTLNNPVAGTLTTGTFGSATSTYNAGTGVWTVSGSVADVNAALASVAFTSSANWDQNATITTRIRDAADAGPIDGAISLNVTAVNDAPTATSLTQSKTATEGGGAVALDDIVVTDVDTGDTVTATFTLSAPAVGTLSTGTYGSATSIFNAGTGVWTVTGSVADVNAALAAVALTPSANNDQNFTITTRIRDAAGTGPADGTISVTVTPVNDAPTDIALSNAGILQSLTGAGADVGTLSSTDIDGPAFIYNLVTTAAAVDGSCASDSDNVSFQIDGGVLETASALAAGTYDLCIQTYDGAARFKKGFLVTVTDDVGPGVSSVVVPGDGTYLAGETLSFTVNTTENVTVSTGGGTPNLPLTVGGTAREANFASGSGSTALVFTYTIQAGDNDTDGIAVGASAVLNGGTVRDAAGNNLTLTFNAVGDTSGVLVDTAAPTLQSLSPIDGSTTVATDANFVMTFSENIALGAGNIVIYNELNDPVATINVAAHAGQLSIANNQLTINPVADLNDGSSYYVQLPSGAVKDVAGIAYEGIADSTTWNFTVADITPPTATIAVADTELLKGETTSVTITFSEAVTGFTNSDLTVPSGNLSTVSSADGGITWTAAFTPDQDIYELDNLITLDNTGIADGAGNTGIGTTSSNEFMIRTQALTLLVTSNLDTGDDETMAATLADDEADGSGLSLREALFWARNGDIITFDLDSGTAGDQGGSIVLNGNQLNVSHAGAIDGDVNDDGLPDVTVSGNDASRVMNIYPNLPRVELDGLILTRGNTGSGGAGLSVGFNAGVTIRNSQITDNTETSANGGGGVYFLTGSNSTVINSTISGNSSSTLGGGVRSIGANVTLALINSTVSNNVTTGAGAHGGGIEFSSLGGSLTLINTTVSGNAAKGAGAVGGGLRVADASNNIFVYNSTIVGNAAASDGGGLSAGATETIINSVIAGNTSGAGATAGAVGSPLATGGAPDDVSGTIEVATNSFFGTTVTITTDTDNLNSQGTADLLLSDLTDNGGFVLAHRPVAGSALSDAGSTAALPADIYDIDGDSDIAEALPLDAIGAERISGASVDIGAVEGNRAPEFFDLDGGNTYVEGNVAVVIDNDITVTDDEMDELNSGNGNYSGASVTIARNGGADASDSFGFVDGSGISLVANELIRSDQIIASFDTTNAGQLIVTFSDANGEIPSRMDINAVMQQLTYASTSNDPDTHVVLDWTFRDESDAPVTETASVIISLKNDAPLVAATGSTVTFTENGTAVDLFSGVSINPVEAAQSIISLQLTVTGVNNGSDEVLMIDGSDVALTQGNSLVTTTNALNASVIVAGTTATVTLSHATGIAGTTAQAVVDSMTYRNTSENPNPLSRVVTLSSVQDNGGIANDGVDTTSSSIAATVTIAAVNNAPTISGVPATVTNQNALYSFTPSATDVDSDTLTFSIANQPTWASFDNETGTLSGIPSQANVGVTSNIMITVSDGSVSTNLPAFSLMVVDVNDAPGISGVPTISVDQDAPYSFMPSASDLDGDTLTFSITNPPTWANFDTNTGALTGTPTVANIGDYVGIMISVSDGALTASLPAFTLSVLATNVAPEISGTPPLTAYVGTVYSFTPTASDADDDVLTFSALGLPAWLTLNTATGQLSGTPAAADADMSYNIALSVSDGKETTTLPVFSLGVEYDGAEPVVTPPEDITINATGLYTPISLRQLLSLAPGISPTAVQEALGDLASDSTGGEDCCVTEPQGLLGNLILLPPGRHEIIWRATNPDDLTGEAVQVVNVRPRVAFGKHQVTVEDTSVQVRVILNGASPFYPLEVPYVIDPASTALAGVDHDAMDGSVIFTEGQTEVSFAVNLLAGGTAGDTRLIFRLDDSSQRSNEPLPNFDPANPDIRDINASAADQHFINIVDGNVIPKVNLEMNQASADTILVGAGSGPVTAAAVVTDPNPGDTHSFNWVGTDSRLSDTDGSATNNTFVFDPAGQVGLRKLEVVTTDSAGGVDISHLHFLILPSLPTLDTGTDTDEDGVDDLTEGTLDTNSNGIPDYLDNMPSSNVLPQVIISTTSYLIECDPGVICGIGQFALGGESGGVQILNDELGATEGLVADEDFEPAGGIFDFVIRDLPTAGQSVRIAIPQQAPIPANAVYRKLIGGQWVNFVENADNTLHSAPGNPGYCPPPGDESWEPGLMESYLCVQLSIQDGGPNDADGVVNSAIADPGAVSVAKAAKPPSPPVEPTPPVTSIDSKGKGGGAMDWSWILLGCIALLAKVAHLPKARLLILLTALLASVTQAQEATDSKYSLRLNLYQAEGSESAADFAGEMGADGMPISLRNYDVTRFAYRIALGMQLSDMATLELGYLNLGDVTVNFDTTTDDTVALSDVLESHYPMSADGVTLNYRFGYALNDQWRISAEGGLFLWQSKIDLSGADINPDLGSGVSPIFGLQLDYSLTRSLDLGVGVNRVFLEGQKVDLWGLNGTWHF